ncbi:DMT family transporter [Tatumella saanichensis]|uniref:DMT family transporter n=1 Tax=Tatumella saanichensis TaxID=480813 RepID=UPI0004A4B799|nr:DMT family transporter [Tatumella saanichensis]
MNNLWFSLAAIAAGVMLPLQAAMNATLAKALGSPIRAAAVSGCVVTLVLTLMALVSGRTLIRSETLSSLPWWAWCGGICGAVVLCATTAVTPRLGSAAMIALVIAGQVLASLALDQFSLFGLVQHSLDLRRGIAALLLILAAWLM